MCGGMLQWGVWGRGRGAGVCGQEEKAWETQRQQGVKVHVVGEKVMRAGREAGRNGTGHRRKGHNSRERRVWGGKEI